MNALWRILCHRLTGGRPPKEVVEKTFDLLAYMEKYCEICKRNDIYYNYNLFALLFLFGRLTSGKAGNDAFFRAEGSHGGTWWRSAWSVQVCLESLLCLSPAW